MAGNLFNTKVAVSSADKVFQGLGSIIKQNRQEQKAIEKKKAFMGALESGDPNKMAEFVISNPDSRELVNDVMKYKSTASKKNHRDTLRNILTDPQNAEQYISERRSYLESVGADTEITDKSMEMYQQNPEAFMKNAEVAFAGVAPKEFKALVKSNAKMTEYQRETLDLKREANDIRRLEKEARTEDNQLKRDELKFKLDERKQKSKDRRVKKRFDASAKIRQQTSLSESIESFIANPDYINSMTGYRGRTPSVTTTGIEAEAYFNNIKNNLTLENLDKMTGVLSETDIKILSTAATALQAGMSAPKMKVELKKIQTVLATKSADVQAQLMGRSPQGQNPQPQQQSPQAQQLPSQNQQGWGLMTDANGNKAYVGPNGEIEEVQ